MRLFINELHKIKASRSVKWVVLVFLLFVLLAGIVWGKDKASLPFATYGFGAPFVWLLSNGAIGFFLYAAVVAGLFASEFEMGVIHNALGSGVNRGGYFIAKVAAIFGVTIAIYLGCIGVLCIFRCWTVGFDPTGQIFADYGMKVVVYNGCGILSLLAYVAIYIFIACLLREAVPTFIAAIVISTLELLDLLRGPLRIAMEAERFIENDAILSLDFVKLFVPCLYIMAVSLMAAYVLFRVRDID